MPRKKETIFVQIASYRDPELVNTIESMISNAKRPKNLVIGICRQYHPEDGFDNLDKYKDDKRFRVVDVLYSESGEFVKETPYNKFIVVKHHYKSIHMNLKRWMLK